MGDCDDRNGYRLTRLRRKKRKKTKRVEPDATQLMTGLNGRIRLSWDAHNPNYIHIIRWFFRFLLLFFGKLSDDTSQLAETLALLTTTTRSVARIDLELQHNGTFSQSKNRKLFFTSS
jgi:hypothetical protein